MTYVYHICYCLLGSKEPIECVCVSLSLSLSLSLSVCVCVVCVCVCVSCVFVCVCVSLCSGVLVLEGGGVTSGCDVVFIVINTWY